MNLLSDRSLIAHRPLLLLVDDDPVVLSSMNDSLRGEFRTRVATAGHRALELANQLPLPDLILLDIELPDLDGYEVCRRLKEDPRTCDVPVMFLSGHSEVIDVTRGLDIGAVDFVSKPIVPPILRARVKTHLRLRDARQQLQAQNATLEIQVEERTSALRKQTREVLRVQEMTIVALGSLAETRDNETGNHIRRTQGYVRVLCEHSAAGPLLAGRYDPETLTLIWKSAPLHDIGKVGIPDAILLKPGRLSVEEFEVMKQHTTLGRRALELAVQESGNDRSFLVIASQIAYCHHEHWNGKGYPEGLAGESIPIPARLMAVADVYDALVSRRIYKAPIPHADAVEMIRQGRGTQFDPRVIDCFIDHAEEMRDIYATYADDPAA